MILPEQPELISIDEAARALGVSERTIRRWEDKGVLTSLLDLAGTKRRYFKKDIEKLFSANQEGEMLSKSSDFISIEDAARVLNVSERTLRRWEEKKILTPVFDRKRNKHRYAKTDVEKLLKFEHVKGSNEPKEFEFIEVYDKQPTHGTDPLAAFGGSRKRIYFAWGFASLVLFLVGSSLVLGLTKPSQNKNTQAQFARSGNSSVLGVATGNERYSLRVNTPAFFGGDVEFLSNVTIQGNIVAKNVINSIAAGEGIGVSSGQNPTITNTGVTSLGGSTGALSLGAGSGITVDGLQISNSDPGSSQDIFKNIKVGDSTITAGSNTDTVTLAAGTGVTLTPDTANKTITIGSTGGNSGGVTSLNSQTGAVTIVAGTGLSLSGLTFSNSGVTSVGTKTGDITLGSGLSMSANQLNNSGVLSLGGQTGALTLSGGTGISTSGTTITNIDPGSSQNIFKNISVGGVPISAASNNDTLNIASGSGIALTTDTSSKTLTIASTITNSTIQSVSGWTQSGSYVTLTNPSNYVGIGTATPNYNFDVNGLGNFTTGILTPKIYPTSDSSTAFQFNKADGTSTIMNIDSLNSRVGIGTVSPGALLDIKSAGAVDSNTTLLLHADGANNSTTFTDSETTPKTITTHGNAKISTTQSKFGGASGYFDGTNSYLTNGSAGADYLIGSEWTFDTWIYPTSVTGSHFLFSYYVDVSNFYDFFLNGNTLEFRSRVSNAETDWISTSTVSVNTWQHIAVVVHNGTLHLYINGVDAGGSGSGNFVTTSNSTLSIGVNPWNNSSWYVGYMDELRISKGIARWTSNFTPSASAYSTGSNLFALTNSSTGDLFMVDSSGNVGIGVAAPSAMLDVAGNASLAGQLTFKNNYGTIQTTNNKTLTLGGNTTGDIQFRPGNSSSSLYLTSGGNVGIGTTNPSATLDVAGNANISGNLTVNGSIISGGTAGVNGWFQRNSGVISPTNITDDLAIGGSSTSSARFQVLGTSGNLSMSGTAVIAPTADSATALTLRAPSTGTASILNITDSTGSTSYMSVDSNGALTLGGSTFSNSGAIHLTNSSNAIMSTAIEGAWTMNSNTFSYRRNITVANNDSISVLPSGYQITIVATGSAAADICSATRTDSNDIRVAYGNTEIARNITRTCSTEVDISFRTYQNISALSSDSNYYIYYGNSALATAGSTYSYASLTLDNADNVANWSASPSFVSLTQENTIKQEGSGSIKVQSNTDGALTAASSFATDTGSSLTTGQVSYWKFDGSNASVISDAVSANDGVAIGTSVTSGLLNNARSFAGSSSSIARAAGPSNLPTGAAPRSVFAWVKPTSSGTSGSIITYGTNAGSRESGLDISGGKAYFVGYSNDLAGTTSLVGGTWYFIGYTYDGTTLKVYVNGSLEASGAKTLNTASSDIGIGYDLPQSAVFYNGLIDEAGIWSKALSQQEITDLYHSGTPDAYTGGYNISTQNNGARSCVDGGDAVAYAMTATASAGASSMTLSSTPSLGCLSAGDEVLIANIQGTSTDSSNVGKYELKTISSVGGATLNLTSTLTNTYDGVGQKIVVQRVPHYSSVTVAANSQLTASPWNGSTGGVLFFRSSGAVTVNGHLNADGIGYRGGTAGTGSSGSTAGQNGESYDGNVGSGGIASTQGTKGGGNGNGNNTLAAAGTRGGGGGGGGTSGAQGDESGTGGGGGGYAGGGAGGGGGTDSNGAGVLGGNGGAVGVNAGGGGSAGRAGANAGSSAVSGDGGSAGGGAGSGATTGQGGGSYSTSAGAAGGGGGGLYGASDLSKFYLGSGGGGGGGFSNQAVSGTDGRAGGGILGIIAPAVTVSSTGSVTANGGNTWSSITRGGSGGAGSGGSILISAGNITTNSAINADGGSKNSSSVVRGGGGGGGGEGIVAMAGNTITGTTSPTYNSVNSSTITNNFYPYSATLTLSPTDLSGFGGINSYLYTSTAGTSILTEFSNDGGSTWNSSSPLYATSANSWNLLNYDISGISASSRNTVTKVRLRFSSDPGTIYFDNVYAAVTNFTGTNPGNTLADKRWGAANLTLNAQGTGYIQFNYDSTNTLQAGTGGVQFYNGGTTQVLGVDSSGNVTLANGSSIKPMTDSTTALSIKKANGDNLLVFDTVNNVASLAGSLTLASSSAQIQTTNNQTMIIGGDTTGDIQFKPGNTTTGLYLAATGNVGVGTQTPSARFTVVGPLNTSTTPSTWNQAMVVDNSAGSSQTITEFRVAGTRRGSIRIDSSGNMVLQGNGGGATYLNWDEGTGGTNFGNGAGGAVGRIDNLGNMYVNGTFGVGTSGPQASMEVRKAASDLLKLTNTTGGAGSTSYIDFQTYGGSGVNARIGTVDGGNYNGSLVFETNTGGVSNGTTTNEAMRITSTGQVGIGTTSPVGMFNLAGASSGQALLNLNYLGTDQNIMTASASGVTKFTLDKSGTIATANGSQWKVLGDSTSALQIANAAGSSVMNFDTTNSRVGIGTTSPLQSLDVNGAFNLFNSTNQRGDLYTGINLDKVWNSPSTFGETNATFSAGLQNPVSNYLTLEPSLGIDLGNGSDGALTVNTAFSVDTGNSLNNGLDGYWKMDEASGTTVVDLINGKNGTATNTTIVSGVSGNARNYTAGSGYIQTNYVETGISSFSVSAWIKTTSTGGYIFYNRNSPAITLGWGRTGDGVGANGQAYVIVDGSGIAIGLHSTVTINDGNWHHIVGTWSGGGSITASQFHIYVDGVNRDGVTSTTGGTSAPLTGDAAGSKIGYNFNTVGGAIDEVGVWTKALSQQEITDLYNSGTGETYIAPYNINTQNNVASGRTCADGGDAVAYTSTTNTSQYATSITLSSAPSAGCLSANDEVLIINMQGTSGDNSNVGKYEIKRVVSVSGTTLNLVQPLSNAYNGTTQKIMIQRVPQYTNVTVSQNSVLTASSWNSATGGVLAFKASGTVSVAGQIKADGLGYRGGTGGTGNAGGTSGESYDGIVGSGGIGTATGTAGGGTGDALSTNGTTAVRGGGGGGGADSNGDGNDGSGGGGGGGYAGGGGGGGSGMDNSAGNNTGGTGGATGVAAGGGGGNGNGGVGYGGAAGSAGQGPYGGAAGSGSTTGQGGGGASGGNGGAGGAGGGGLYGSTDLSQIYMGSGGGGAGGTYKTGSTASSGGGGGGIVMISGGTVSVSGSITSNGSTGGNASGNYGGGGGGAGGSVRILGDTVAMGSSLVTASGGSISSSTGQSGGGGAGGVGRIAVYSPSGTGTTSPSYSSLSNPGENYISGEQTWYSAIIDMGQDKTAKPNILNVNYLLDGTDNIAPKFEIQASNIGAFAGEETTYPNGPTTWYQAGGTYSVNNGSDTDITGQVQRFRYWRVIVKMDTGGNTTDTPVIRSIELKDYAPSISTLVGGNVGIGTLLPLFKLDVQDFQSATATASITNLSSSSTASVLSLKVGATNPTSNNYFLTFLDGSGNIVGKIQGNGAGGVSYATTGVDFAEYFRKENKDEELKKGDVVCIGSTGGATKCQNGTNILGVISGKAGFVGGSQHDQDPNYVAVGLIGQLPVNVSSQSGKINPGDKLTVENGVVKTASSGGEILGVALEGYSGEGNTAINARINSGWYGTASNGSTNSNLSDLESRLDLLSQSVNTLQNIVNFNLTSTPSAQLLSASDLDLNNATLSGSLMVLGKTTLGDVGITGKINSGLLVINGLDDSVVQGDSVTTINTLSGDLYLQNLGLGGVNILNGKVKIDKSGNIVTQGKVTADKIETKGVSITSDQNISDGTILSGKTQIIIYSTAMKKSSKVFITPTTQISVPLIVSNKSDGSFTVTISKSQTQDVNFDWMIVGTQ